MPRTRCTRRTGPLRGYRRRRAGARLRHPGEEDGFTIIESVLALGLIFAVLVGLLHTMVTSSRGIVTGRQRNVAVGLANQVIETARGNNYDQVGHSSTDATLGTDTAITTVGTTKQYENEPLAYATGVALWPTHLTTSAVGGTTYTTKVYVTTITPASGDAYKRVTAVVSWSNPQYNQTAIVPEIKLSSYVFNAHLPADPLLQGLATASGGYLTINASGSASANFIEGYVLSDATVTLPKATADLDSQLVKKASGLAQSASTSLRGNATTYASGSAAASGSEASSPSIKVSSSADNDAGTTTPAEAQDSSSDAGGSIGRTNVLDIIKTGSTNLSSKSTVTTSSFNNPTGDSLPYTVNRSTGPASLTMPITVQDVLSGTTPIGNIITTGATDTIASSDRDDSGPDRVVKTTSTVAHPATTLFSFSATGLSVVTATGMPYSGMVKIGDTGNVTASANAGPLGSAPSITGGSFEVCVYDTSALHSASGTCPAGYKRLAVVPGTAGSLTGHADMALNGDATSLDVTVTSAAKTVSSTLDGATYEKAEATVNNWLRVVVDVTISNDARLRVELNYGQISARSKYCLPTDAACIQEPL